ncbi:MAG TPA: hypothetical protein VLU47_17705, partial [Blastocatellia bacterium]|nr:hypothetical protein [Blastocatellia bacterium]
MLKAILLILVLPVVGFSQADKSPEAWKPLNFFVGHWEGTGKGQPGDSKIEREYQFVLNGKFLHLRNKST